MAVTHSDPSIGPVPDIINAMHKLSEDKFAFGCQRSIYVLLGDPAATNARLEVLSGSDCGMAFGRSCARDDRGNFYFVGARGGFFVLDGGMPKSLSEASIPRRLRDLDFGSNWVELVWDQREKSMRIFLCPLGAGGSQRLSYVWERTSDSMIPHEDSFGTSSSFAVQPTCAKSIEGDTAAERVLLYGTEDGHVMVFDESAKSEGPVALDSQVLLQITPKAAGKRFMFRRLKVALAQDGNGCNFEAFGSSIAEQIGVRHVNGTLEPGPNPTKLIRLTGRNCFLRLRNAALGESWAFEEGAVEAEIVGNDRGPR
jgi:hypothetical protein